MISRNVKTQAELDDHAVVDAVRSFVNVQARDWNRRQLNAVLPRVLRLVDEARANGDAPDVAALIRQVFLERQIPALASA